MTYRLGTKSRTKLRGVHPDLVKVVQRAIELTEVDFTVLEGVRTAKRQAMLKAKGASWTLDSRHLTGHAIDFGALLNGKVEWHWSLYPIVAKAFKAAAAELGIPIVWGGDWKQRDGGHVELRKKEYPA